MLTLFRKILLLGTVAAQSSVPVLDPVDFKAGIDAGAYDAILDVRSQEEWDQGHIGGATLALNMATYPDAGAAAPADFAGCETCTIVVYCRTGGRATVALENLIQAGFNGTLYNGQGISQWEAAGYSLVTDASVVPPCTLNGVGQCAAALPSSAPSAAPSMTSTIAPSASPAEVTVTTLQPEEFKNGIDNGLFDAVIDVRRQDEWDAGHIDGATFALNLAVFGDPTQVTASPADFMGCETCTLVVYCRSGGRAAAALENLIAAGFNGTLYNGQGTSQWEGAGYPLVTTDSVAPPCTKSEIGTCAAGTSAEPTTTAPTPADSSGAVHSSISAMAIFVGLWSALQIFV